MDVLKVNEDELFQLLHWFVDSYASDTEKMAEKTSTKVNRKYAQHASKSLLEAILQLLRLYSLQRLVVTRGADGYVVFDSLGQMIAEGKTPIVEVVDTVGAGDAFLAIILLGELLGWLIDTTADRAAQFAAAVCTHRGAVADDLSFYDAWRVQWQLPDANNHENLAPAR